MKIFLEKCTNKDFDLYYELRCDEENIYWTGYERSPDKENLRNWFKDQLKRKDRIFFLAKSQSYPNEAIGYLYLDIVGENNNIIETGHGAHSKFKGKGIGTKIIKFALEYSKIYLPFIDRVDGWIAEDNIGSIKNVLKNNYSLSKDTKKIYFEPLKKEILMKRYFYEINR